MKNIKDLNIRDPYVLTDNGNYYLFCSKKDGTAGFMCYKSKDLVNFEEPKIVFTRGENFWATKDFWAPEVHKYKGKYYLLASLKSETRPRGTQIFVSDTPDGNYVPLVENPITPNSWECLDGTLFIENNTPYLIFCRERLEIDDGEIYIMELTQNLKVPACEPICLFKASTAKWTVPITGDDKYVTDGPFIFKKDGLYNMFWSSFSQNGYALGHAVSDNLFRGWKQSASPIYDDDGGHAMLFEKFNGEKMVAFHSPNKPNGEERIQIVPMESFNLLKG